MQHSSGWMQIETVADGGLQLRLFGDIDIAFTVTNRAVLEDVVVNPPHHLAIDAAQLNFIDSTGLHVLTTIVTCVRDAGGEVHTPTSSPAFARLIDVTNLGERFGMVTGASPR